MRRFSNKKNNKKIKKQPARDLLWGYLGSLADERAEVQKNINKRKRRGREEKEEKRKKEEIKK